MELPHNTLVIMWPPTQEEWKHEARFCSGSEMILPLQIWLLRKRASSLFPRDTDGNGQSIKLMIDTDCQAPQLTCFPVCCRPCYI